ncbi:outer membrane protein [Bartonella sp. DGB1]|uniref:outer membrane protein n=1 Tax=Bartonella sp. DGB1 TaxID=3239807 RepID=UPI0035235959
MKLKYLYYILLGSVFSMSQVSATTVSKKTDLPKPSNSKVLDNNWSGVYVGLQYSLAINHIKNPSMKMTLTGREPGYSSGYETKTLGTETMGAVTNLSHLGGLFLGYNHAIIEQVVVGAELDVSYKLKAHEIRYKEADKHTKYSPKYTHMELPLNSYLDSSLRARIGVNLGDFLPYIAGGINVIYDLQNKYKEEHAKGMVENDGMTENDINDMTIKIEGNNSSLRFSWNLGAGLEYKLHKNISVRAEYRYNNISSKQDKKIIFTQKEDEKINQTLTYGLDGLSSHDVRISFSYYF